MTTKIRPRTRHLRPATQ